MLSLSQTEEGNDCKRVSHNRYDLALRRGLSVDSTSRAAADRHLNCAWGKIQDCLVELVKIIVFVKVLISAVMYYLSTEIFWISLSICYIITPISCIFKMLSWYFSILFSFSPLDSEKNPVHLAVLITLRLDRSWSHMIVFWQSTPLDLIETGKSLKVQAERPHLVSLGSGRLSTAITLLPLPEGKDLRVCVCV